MARYVARFRGAGDPPAETADSIRRLDGTTILDESPRMLLIEAPDDSALRALLDPGSWLLSEERLYQVPSPRQKLGR